MTETLTTHNNGFSKEVTTEPDDSIIWLIAIKGIDPLIVTNEEREESSKRYWSQDETK